MEEIIAGKFMALRNELNERQRRLWAASEAISLGHGGITKVANATGMSRTTITQGIDELRNEKRLTENRVRREGAGRKKLSDKLPKLLPSLDALVEPTAKGDPMSPLRWTTKSTRRLCEMLNDDGFEISHTQVCRLLHDLEYQLSGNRKSLEGGTNPDRNEQFEFINEQSKKFLKQNCPVISVDAKKKELIGDLPSRRSASPSNGPLHVVSLADTSEQRERVLATCGSSICDGTARSPYGIYDLKKNLGWVNVGIDHDTAEFAVESIRRWYKHLGKELYPNAKHLYVTADGGGSNSSRSRLWKYCLQEFSDESRLTIHVSHFPPGTSKWNKIEHRLFNHISMNWKGEPLVSLDVIINLIGHTTSQTGLKVYAMEDKNIYPTKRKITDEQMESLKLIRNDVLGKWNYKISPR